MNISELLEYYSIAKDSKDIKRVEELAHIRDVAVRTGNKDDLDLVDAELNTMSSDPVRVEDGKSCIFADDKSVSEYANGKPISKQIQYNYKGEYYG